VTGLAPGAVLALQPAGIRAAEQLCRATVVTIAMMTIMEAGPPLSTPGEIPTWSTTSSVSPRLFISAYLRPFFEAYDPNWRGPKDAMASCFYRWPE
jgi:Polyketide synthesis cyclase